MKKCLFVLFAGTVLFAGCSNSVSGGGGSYERPKRNEVRKWICNGKGYESYMIKFNFSDYLVPYDETGYLISSTKARNIDSIQNTINIPKQNKKKLNVDYYSVEKMQQKQYELSQKYKVKSIYTRQMLSNGGGDDKTFPVSKEFWFTKKINTNNYEDLKKVTLTDSEYDGINNENLYKMAEGEHCNVYYSDVINSEYANTNNIGKLLKEKNSFKKIAEDFDKIYKNMDNLLNGNTVEYDISNESTTTWTNTPKKINLIVYDIDGDATDEQGLMTFGMFSPMDLCSQPQLDYWKQKGEFCYGNSTKCLYLDSYALLNNYLTLKSTIVHEFSHMITYIQKCVKPNHYDTEMPTWFTEMIALVTEDLFSNYLEIPDENSPKNRLPNIAYGYNYGFEQWQTGDEVLFSYANAFAYGSFLVRNYGGLNFYKELLTDSEYKVGKKGIEKAISLGTKKDDNYKNTLKNYYIAATFPKESPAENDYTLNRTVGFDNNSEFGFKAIDLTNIFFEYYDDLSELHESDCTLWILKPGKDGQCNIFPSGCSIHFLDSDLDSYEFMLQSFNIDYYGLSIKY